MEDHHVRYSFSSDKSMPITAADTIAMKDTGNRFCVNCNRRTSKLFGQGFCYPCFKDSPENSDCILRPELCRAHLGEGRDVAWEDAHHNQPHHVYLANSGGLKVGITRSTQIPTRWIDQGAIEAAILATTPNRYTAGILEVELKRFMSDKTAWQRMVKGEDPELDLANILIKTGPLLTDSLRQYLIPNSTPLRIHYPVMAYPTKAQSTKLDKEPAIQATLSGIRGQYLLFNDNRVLNIRNHSGYEVELTITSPH